MRNLSLAFLGMTLSLAACNQNTAVGNDRETEVEPAPTPAAQESATAALENVATAIVKPETMSGADLASIGGLAGKCAIVLTEVAFPSFVYQSGQAGTIKLNGKLIELPSTGPNRYQAGGLTVALQPNGEVGDAGLPGMNMIVVPPGAKDELGYSGFVKCNQADP